MEKNKIQIGTIIHLEKGKRPSDLKETFSEPIYADWTPELQKGQDEMLDNFAKFVCEEMKKYIAAGGDLSNLKTKEGQEHLQSYRQKILDEQEHKRELREIKRKMSDKEIEEFLKWKNNIK